MAIDEIKVTKHIVKRFTDEFLDSLDVDVVIGGAGPSGLVAAKYLADAGKDVVIYERKLSPGGGMWGGGMTFPVIVVQEASTHILEEFGVKLRDEGEGYYTGNSIEATAKLMAGALDAGAKLFNTISIEDLMVQEGMVKGVVINWSTIDAAGLHVDPLTMRSKAVIDATGHPCELVNVLVEKTASLKVDTGKVKGEKGMWAEIGEKMVVENTSEVFPGLYVAGMAANAVYGAPRMGPIFGGMLQSGKKVAELILAKI